MFGSRWSWLLAGSVAIGLLLVASIVAAVYFLKPHATLYVTTGPAGSAADAFMQAFVKVTTSEHPRIQFTLVPVPDLAASSKAIEDHQVNLAIVRSDVSPPANGMTIAILRRAAVAFVLPPKSPIDTITKLYGKTVGIPQGFIQENNAQALDTILSYYNISPTAVKRVFLAREEIGEAVQQKRVNAVLAIGPVGPGEVVDAVSAIARATKGTPGILAIDEAEAIAKRFPGFESLDVPAGAFRAKPATPNDQVTTLAVTYRFVVPDTMLNVVAGALARSIFATKAKLMALSPLANEIEAPDPDSKSPILPIHPGVTAYLSSGEQSFFEEFQSYIYIGTMIASVLGSAFAIISGRLSSQKSDAAMQQITRLIEIADQAASAELAGLDALEKEFNQIVASLLTQHAVDTGGSSAFSVAIDHTRHAIEHRRQILEPRSPQSA
ncbi:TAXI family TRAP transporter solute-binding subunit [Beijerinckia indica]|uniref:TRAP transporter solute receptor, TAXI family n=1 Tax=Beijerinckia indica subsp. indica (strain ATCC 9039 / DSM 1715 / NCIMB 8712) TaxID=395963 RepID=B2IHM7_BEII9|nr:TAXI family TRAP transporter solute-binding subunit [Beijerinckia indica]ACB94548.1 conserved hypothetical protein [Beijerinckia indica subsp. indica ATCC 9039]